MHFGCSCEFVRASNARVHELFMRRDVASAASAAAPVVRRPGWSPGTARATRIIIYELTFGSHGFGGTKSNHDAVGVSQHRYISSTVARAKDRQGASPRKRRERVPLWRRWSLLDQGGEEAWSPLLGADAFFWRRRASASRGMEKGVFTHHHIRDITVAIEVASFRATSSKQRVTTILYIRGRESAWNALDGDLGFRGHMVSPCFTATKKALQKRRQKLGVSAGDISGLKLSRRSKHVLPAWFCAPCPTDWMVGWSVGRSVGRLTDQ
ncbi:hypothetical protein ALC56_11292 [Trachymyrmex septentrionalis]|uniref:Uncharacterized protein n=1 Tax=Trachymyrmex septentrionalis TaxID=34720 RepID=A0A195F1D2_9HYME|nr:hypothetical protein ALC56_11292 [Trachymyrmex septentrionalis]